MAYTEGDRRTISQWARHGGLNGFTSRTLGSALRIAETSESADRPALTLVRPVQEKTTPTVASQHPERDSAIMSPTMTESTDNRYGRTETAASAKQHNRTLQPAEIHMDMYDADHPENIVPLVTRYTGEQQFRLLAGLSDSDKLAARESKRKSRVAKARGTSFDSEAYDKERAEKLSTLREETKIEINENVFGTIRADLGLADEDAAAEIFEENRQYANEAVKDHADSLFPGKIEITQLRNQVAIERRPGDLVEDAVSNTSSPTLRYEIQRQAVDSAISLAQQSGLSWSDGFKLAQIQRLLDAKLFAGQKGETEKVTFYGQFSDETNGLVPDGETGLAVPPITEAPTEDSPEGTHYKYLPVEMHTLDTGERAMTLYSKKKRSAMIEKARRKAQERVDAGSDGRILPLEDVTDPERMKIVIDGSQADADRIANKVFDILTDTEHSEFFHNKTRSGRKIKDDDDNFTGTFNGKGDVRYGNRGGIGQSSEVNSTKIEMGFEGVTHPIKIVVVPMSDYVDQDLKVGVYDPENGTYTGPAHDLQRTQRKYGVDLFPDTIYEGLDKNYGPGTQAPPPALETTANRLRDTNVHTVK